MADNDGDDSDWSTISDFDAAGSRSPASPPPPDADDNSSQGEKPCPICEDLNTFFKLVDPAALVRSAEAKACAGCGLLLDALHKFGVDISSLKFSDDFPAPEPSLSISGEESCKVSAGKLQLEVYASKGRPPAFTHFTEATDVSGYTGSEQTMHLIREWLRECSEDHWNRGSCLPNKAVPLPHRVLDVGFLSRAPDEATSVHLVETSPATRDAYACLSHCWGTTPVIRTLKANYEEHKTAGIAFSRLPRTFQDAVTVARALDIRYLWIDSLCIVQDDADDWRREAALMANIYQNGRFTITASNSAGSSGGCFADASGYTSKELFAETLDGEGNRQQHYGRARRYIDHGNWPILQRGWVFQERLLSPRVLHFGHAEVVWECFDTLRCECSRSGQPEFHRLDFMLGRKGFDPWLISPEYLTEQLEAPTDYWKAKWRDIVSTYSRLRLTFAKDIFPALSGAAKQMQRHRGSRYVAGLWEDVLVEDLLWESADAHQPRPPEADWHSPTWSWALVSGYGSSSPYITGASYDVFRSSITQAPEHTHVTVDDVSVSPVGTDPTGQLNSGAYIVLTGPAVTATLERPFGEDSIHSLRISGHTEYQHGGGSREEDPLAPRLDFCADYALSGAGRGFVATGTQLTCLKTASSGEDASRSPARREFFYLVLRPLSGVGSSNSGDAAVFERIGLLKLISKGGVSLYGDLEKTVMVKII